MENIEKAELKFSPIIKMLGITILVALITVFINVSVWMEEVSLLGENRKDRDDRELRFYFI